MAGELVYDFANIPPNASAKLIPLPTVFSTLQKFAEGQYGIRKSKLGAPSVNQFFLCQLPFSQSAFIDYFPWSSEVEGNSYSMPNETILEIRRYKSQKSPVSRLEYRLIKNGSIYALIHYVSDIENKQIKELYKLHTITSPPQRNTPQTRTSKPVAVSQRKNQVGSPSKQAIPPPEEDLKQNSLNILSPLILRMNCREQIFKNMINPVNVEEENISSALIDREEKLATVQMEMELLKKHHEEYLKKLEEYRNTFQLQ